VDRGLLWASVASLLGLVTMGAIALTVAPPQVPLGALADRIGSTVVVDGELRRIEANGAGFTRMRLAADNRSVEVVVPEAVNASTGDLVRATGTVESFGGRIQLRLDRAADLRVLREWRSHHAPLSRILGEPWDHIDTHVRTSGDVRIDGRATWLQAPDTDARVQLLVRDAPVDAGPWLIDGLLEYRLDPARLRLVVLDARPLEG
jgi:hypothetical protein